MNEPTERAQALTGKTTARQLLTAIRAGGDSLYMHGEAVHDRPSYSDAFTFTVSSGRKDRKTKAETLTKVDVPGWVSNGSTSETKEHTDPKDPYRKWKTQPTAYRPRTGFWHLSYNETIRNVLELLPAEAEIAFHVYLDAATHEYLIRAECPMQFGRECGLHGDSLYLVASWDRRGKRQEKTFLICTRTGPHNSSRFGSPRHDRDETGGG